MALEHEEIKKILDDPKFHTLKTLGFIDEIAIRNFSIKSEYKKLRKSHSQVDSIFILSQKHNLSFDSINTILFRKRRMSNPRHRHPKKIRISSFPKNFKLKVSVYHYNIIRRE